jgi:hypothetical protein
MAETPIYKRIAGTQTYRLVGHGVNGRFVGNTTDRRIYTAVPTDQHPHPPVVEAQVDTQPKPQPVVMMTMRKWNQWILQVMTANVPQPPNTLTEVVHIQRERRQR